MGKNKLSVICVFILLLFKGYTYGQTFATELIPVHDSTIHRFVDIHDLYFLHQQEHKTLDKCIRKILKAKSFAEEEKWINQLVGLRSSQALSLAAFDYYFSNKAPVAGTNVERFLKIILQHEMYTKINRVMQYDFVENASLKDSVRKRIGWQFGYGAFYYLSPEDSLYLAKMKRIAKDELDASVIDIIETYLKEQSTPFRYDVQAMVKDIDAIPHVVDVIHDGCVTKTLQLPNWDNIGVVYVNGTDTLERVYTLQIGSYRVLRLGRWFQMPLKGGDYVWYKKAEYGLHYVAKTRKRCDENLIRHKRNEEE